MSEAAFTLEAHHKDMYREAVEFRSQQFQSKLRSMVHVENNIRGKAYYFDSVGQTEAKKTNEKFPPSPHQSVEHYRRKIVRDRYQWGYLIDQDDRLANFTHNDGVYVKAGASSFNRSFDAEIIRALSENAIAEDPDGQTISVPLPATQKVGIQEGSTGPADVNLNEKKVRIAVGKISSADNMLDDPDVNLMGMMSPNMLYLGLMSQDKVVNGDFNVIKPLHDGGRTFVEWMGITWVLSNLLPLIPGTSTDRYAYVWEKMGVGLGIWSDLTIQFTKRGELSMTDYIYQEAWFRATRKEEVKVVQIACNDTVSATTNP